MHARAGVKPDRLHAAVVLHGPAVWDVTLAGAYGRHRKGGTNATQPLVEALLAAGVEVIVCGQSAASQGVTHADLLPGVRMALSAMTAHLLLQRQGYLLNPF